MAGCRWAFTEAVDCAGAATCGPHNGRCPEREAYLREHGLQEIPAKPILADNPLVTRAAPQFDQAVKDRNMALRRERLRKEFTRGHEHDRDFGLEL